MAKFIIYFENATLPNTIEMMNSKGFLHKNLLFKAFCVPVSLREEVPTTFTYEFETEELDAKRAFTYFRNDGSSFTVLWSDIQENLLQEGLNLAALDFYKALFLFANEINLIQTALRAGWEITEPSSIMHVVDGLAQAVKYPELRISSLHIDLFLPDIIDKLIPENVQTEFLRNETGTGYSKLSAGGILSFREGNTLRKTSQDKLNGEMKPPQIK